MSTDRLDRRRRLFALASEQAGYFSAAQAHALGYSYSAQAYHVRAGTWNRVDRGLFRLVEWVPDLNDDLARWTLWAKGHAVISHETALNVYGIGEFESSRVHLTVPRGFRMRDSAVVLHFGDLLPDDLEQRGGFALTTVLRSLIDVAAGGAEGDQLVYAIEEALSAGVVTRRQLRARSEQIDSLAALRIERALSA